MDYPFEPLKERISGTEVTIVGVEHEGRFFERYRSFFEEAVHQNDSVVLERNPLAEFSRDRFYGKIGSLAHEQRKSVYQADPLTGLSIIMEPAIITLLLGTAAGANFEGLGRRRITRRDFLKLAGLSAVAASVIGGTHHGTLLREFLGEDFSEYDWKDLLSYGDKDFRDIRIAEGLGRIAQEGRERNLLSLHGSGHTGGIREYLRSPALRNKKYLYLLHELMGRTKIKEYRPVDSGWALTREF